MGRSAGGSKRSEKGLLTPDNCVVALIDHQPQMLFGTSNFDRQEIINNTVAFGKATRVFDVPVILTKVAAGAISSSDVKNVGAKYAVSNERLGGLGPVPLRHLAQPLRA